ncbi:MAG TPA: cytosine permease [Rhodoglobus sp.]|nr:cytosine permease [Rhodoglobus sp.]
MSTTTKNDAGTSALSVETNGINTITEAERKGKPRDLFWPWAAANVSVFGIAYGSYLLGFGVSFWQATVIGLVGIVVSFFFVGVIALAGKRGSAPTLVLSRSIFGVNGGRVPSILSWVLTVGWETVLVSLATLATATVFTALGWNGGPVTQVVALIVVAALVIAAGVMGFDLILKLQFWITIVTVVLTIGYIVITVAQGHIDLAAVAALPAGDVPAVIGGFVFMMTGFGLGWVNAAADYSRYLPRNASSKGVVGWTTFGASVAPIILLIFGLLLAGSSADLRKALGNDPIGALSTLLPIWFLLPFALVAILGLVGGAVLDIYSSGLSLLTAGIKVPRPVAAGIDGVIMVLGAIYVVFIAQDFFFPFQGFLITLGVPIAAWAGIFLADTIIRKKGYAEKELYTATGRYGSWRWLPIALLVIGSVVGWGFVTNTYADWLAWQGYFMDAIGGKEGAWAFANLGVLFSLLIGFLGYLAFGRAAVKKQESTPLDND